MSINLIRRKKVSDPKAKARQILKVGNTSYTYYSLESLNDPDINRLPVSLKVLLENLIRHYDGTHVKESDIDAFKAWTKKKSSNHEISFMPARVLMQDFTGVPAVVDLAAMRDAVKKFGGDPTHINPMTPVDLVIDHSVMVDNYGTSESFAQNVHFEYQRNKERYAFLRWGQQAFDNFRVVPPGTGICHQVNLEYLAQTVWTSQEEGSQNQVAYPDTLVGTDSHTTMVNGLAVLGWGVGGIEAEAVMLGQSISMIIPEVIGFKLTGALPEGTTATDLVLTVTQILRSKGVVGKFVEFFGPGLNALPLADRATIANMAPEYGATCGFFPIDQETIKYLEFTGRDAQRVKLVEAYAKAQGLWRDETSQDPIFTEIVELNLANVKSSMAGPKRPQDRVNVEAAPASFDTMFKESVSDGKVRSVQVEGQNYALQDGHVVIAAITSCTNTSNPSVMVGAGLLARKALAKGLNVKPWVKTSLAPGSKVVSDYLNASKLDKDLDKLGFNLVGYGCTTCIGNSGPLKPEIAKAIENQDLMVASVLSGNRNFEGRIHPQSKSNYLASPLLVVAYALLGTMRSDITKEPLGLDQSGKPVYLKDVWPSQKEIEDTIRQSLTPQMFRDRYAHVFEGDKEWQAIQIPKDVTYVWDAKSTYVKNPPYFDQMELTPNTIKDVKSARALAILGDSITTDHISPAGSIKTDGPAGKYLTDRNITPLDFNSYGARRGNDEIMVRGTFANIRLKNEMAPGTTGGITRFVPGNETMSIFDASMKYQAQHIPLIVIAGKEYGTGSSRDWAAKGTMLLGVKAVIAESFERIHRSNLIGMGILPLEFKNNASRHSLKLTGDETFDVTGIEKGLSPKMDVNFTITRSNGQKETIALLCRIDTEDEVKYFENGGILHYVLRQILSDTPTRNNTKLRASAS
jgi:aconitate hydratase